MSLVPPAEPLQVQGPPSPSLETVKPPPMAPSSTAQPGPLQPSPRHLPKTPSSLSWEDPPVWGPRWSGPILWAASLVPWDFGQGAYPLLASSENEEPNRVAVNRLGLDSPQCLGQVSSTGLFLGPAGTFLCVPGWGPLSSSCGAESGPVSTLAPFSSTRCPRLSEWVGC